MEGLVNFSPRGPWFYPAALHVVSDLANRDCSLWLSPANDRSADISYPFIRHPRYGQWAVGCRSSNAYIRPTARQAHNGTSLTVGNSGTWFMYLHIEPLKLWLCT